MAPTLTAASTSTNSPATSASVAQLISRASLHGLSFSEIATAAVTASAVTNVGNPRSLPIAEATSKTATTTASPANTKIPLRLNFTSATSLAIAAGNAPRNSARNSQRSAAYVTTMDTTQGTPNSTSHRPSGGMSPRNTTRFAGFEIGNKNDAAFAINAQTKRYGNGVTRALRTAAKIAGVNTTAVASFDIKMVTAVPTPYTSKKSRAADPRALRKATPESQSNTPHSRANSDSNIIPTKNKQTSTAFPAARQATRQLTSRNPTSSTTPPPTHHTSATPRGRTSINKMLTPTIPHTTPCTITAGIN